LQVAQLFNNATINKIIKINPNMNNKKLLPHPIRAEIDKEFNMSWNSSRLFGVPMPELFVGRENCSMEQMYNLLNKSNPGFASLYQTLSSSGEGTNSGCLDSLSYPARLKALNGRIYQLDEMLTEQLDNTDIGNPPVAELIVPEQHMYCHLKNGANIELSYTDGSVYPFEGAYISEIRNISKQSKNLFHAKSIYLLDQLYGNEWRIDKIRILEFCFIGSPVNATHGLMDDMNHNIVLYLLEGDKTPIQDVLTKHFKMYGLSSSIYVEIEDTYTAPSEMHKNEICQCVDFIAKALLAINSNFVRKLLVNETDHWQKRINRVKNNKSKLRKVSSQAQYAFNRIVIEPVESQSQLIKNSSSVQAHFRRGHFRYQAYGPEKRLRKLLWIKPTRVGV
jgi:hypothetical protein